MPRRPGPTPPRSTGCASTRPGWPRWPPACATWPGWPTRWARWSTVGSAPTACGSSGCRVPLGVVGIIYENRPNVTSDAAGLCLKSGNAVLLRGSSSAISLQPGHRRRAAGGIGEGRAPDRGGRAGGGHRPGLGGGLHAARRADRLPHPPGRALADRLGGRARHRALRPRRGGQLPCLRGRRRRPVHGRVDRGQRQDPTAGSVQQRGDPAGPPGGGRGLPAPDGRGARRGDPARRRGHPGAPARRSGRPPTRTSPPSSWA